VCNQNTFSALFPDKPVHRIILLLLCFVTVTSFAQIGGKTSFDFLNVPVSARLSALGGVNVSLADRDITFFAGNPALAGDTLTGVASAGYQFYAGDIGNAFFSYAMPTKKLGTLLVGVQHIGYGTLQGYDDSGVETLSYRSGETALLVSGHHQVSNFRMGATLKGVFSSIAGYRASALLLDLGGVFIHPEKRLTAGLTIKNIGFVMDEYSTTGDTGLPFDVQVGTTFKPEFMPLRFSFTAFNLTKRDITYYNPDDGDEKPGNFQKVMSHVVIGAEILLHKNVNAMVGYNYLMHQALRLNPGGGGAGLSFGFSAFVKAMELSVSRSGFVAGSAGYSFTLSANVNKFLKRQQSL
jgi:hypothetical protein